MKTTKILISIITILVAIIILGGGYFLGQNAASQSSVMPTPFAPTTTPNATSTPSIQTTPLATGTTFISGSPNPASAFCIKQGGSLTMQTRGDGGQYGICTFDGGYACEEWAMFRDECPVGGIRTTGFDTIEQKYCAWAGGSTLAVPDTSCTFPDGSVCNDEDFYNGTCQKGQ